MLSFRFYLGILLLIFLLTRIIIPQDYDFVCTTDPDSIPTNIGELKNTTWTLKILLVEFSDIKHKSPGFTYQ